MGNIRPNYIKRVAIELVDRYPERFSGDFEANKAAVNDLTDTSGKKMRNRIAGYATTYKHTKDRE